MRENGRLRCTGPLVVRGFADTGVYVANDASIHCEVGVAPASSLEIHGSDHCMFVASDASIYARRLVCSDADAGVYALFHGLVALGHADFDVRGQAVHVNHQAAASIVHIESIRAGAECVATSGAGYVLIGSSGSQECGSYGIWATLASAVQAAGVDFGQLTSARDKVRSTFGAFVSAPDSGLGAEDVSVEGDGVCALGGSVYVRDDQ